MVEEFDRLAELQQQIRELHGRLGPQLYGGADRQEQFDADARKFHMLVGRLLNTIEPRD